jgi:hypothetical protein
MGKIKTACYPNAVSSFTITIWTDGDKFHRVLNTFKSMVGDADVLEREDMYILNRMKAFISNEEVNRFAAAKQLVTLIERAVSFLVCYFGKY